MRRILIFIFILSASGMLAQPCSPPTVLIMPPPTECACSQIVLSSNVTSTGGPFTFKWEPGGDKLDAIVVSPCFVTTYTLTVKNACGDSTVKSITVTPDHAIAWPVCCDTMIHSGDSAKLYVRSHSSQKYKWTPNTGLNCDTCDTVIAKPTITTHYSVTEIDSLGCSADTSVIIWIIPSAVPFISGTDFVNIYPNPSSTEFTLNIATKAMVKVCDVTGRLLYSKMENAGTITFGKELNPGIYFLFIDGKLGVKVVRL